MALLKTKTQPTGTTCEYWKVIETNINWLNQSAHVSLAGFLDQAARQAGKQPLEAVSFDWSGEDFPFTLSVLDQENENTVKVAYEKIKESKLDEEGNETNFFVDAIDA